MTALSLVAAWWNPVGAVGACMSRQAAVETVAIAAGERFALRSKATIQTPMLRPQARPRAVYWARETSMGSTLPVYSLLEISARTSSTYTK